MTEDREVDRRFVDALLHHHFGGDQVASHRRVAAALQQIDAGAESNGGTASGSPWKRALRPLAAAAALASLLLVPALLSDTASAAVARAVVAMSRLTDFHYEIEVDSPVFGAVSGDLWARGEDLLVIRQDRVTGELWVGEGRDSAWVIPTLPRLPVLVGEKGSLRDILLNEKDDGLPFLRITTLLNQLRDSFELEFGLDRDTVIATRLETASSDLADKVEVRFGPDGAVLEFDARWDGVLGSRRVRMKWVDGDEKPASFYEHAAHHDAGRSVVDRR